MSKAILLLALICISGCYAVNYELSVYTTAAAD